MSREEISAGLGDLTRFYDEMLALAPRIQVVRGGLVTQPLARLKLDVASDPTVALFDGFAAVADVLSFYQDRILNEGFLDTALEQGSLALIAQGLGVGAGLCVAATVDVALIAQSGASVQVPANSVFQATPAKQPGNGGKATTPAPTFLSAATVTADPALNQLTPLQTRPPVLDPESSSLLLAGTGLGLSSGDFLLLVVPDAKGNEWVRLTVHGTSENSTLGTTTVDIGASLRSQWQASGATLRLPASTDKVALYALDLACRLFGYNAPAWSQQTLATQMAAVPPGQSPSAYSEWPDFEIDLSDLDLQAVYSKLLPSSQFLLETPEYRLLGSVEAVARDNLNQWGVSGQATRVTLAPGAASLPNGLALIPAREGHGATTLNDGRVLITGGIGAHGPIASVEIYDPSTGLVTPMTPLPAPRGWHSATLIDGVVYLAGGLTSDGVLADSVLALDPATMSFAAIDGITLDPPRIGHAATVLPDGSLMLSGGLVLPTDADASAPVTLDTLIATNSVVIYVPNGGWRAADPPYALARARAWHSATLCPVVPASGGARIGEAVLFIGGVDAAQPAHYWNDAEVTDTSQWRSTGTLFPISESAAGRAWHVATPLPDNGGLMMTGGLGADGPVPDNWLAALLEDTQGGGATAIPSFFLTQPLTQPRGRHAAGLMADGTLVAAGGETSDQVIGAVDIFTIAGGVSIASEADKVVSATRAGTPLPRPQSRPGFVALATGKLLLTGGVSALPDTVTDAVVAYDPAIGTMSLIAGPILDNDTLCPVASIALRDGTILLIGATQPPGFPASPETMNGYAWTFDPATGLSTSAGAPVAARLGAALAMLSNGSVLITGGLGLTSDGGLAALDTAELYDPRSRSFRAIGSKLSVPRFGHTATSLSDGSVIVVGGLSLPEVTYDKPGLLGVYSPALDTADLYAASGQGFTTISTPLPQGVALHAATLLSDGDVLITGGINDLWSFAPFSVAQGTPLAQAVIYDHVAQGFAQIAPMATARAGHSASMRADGKVLVAGGGGDLNLTPMTAAELFDPAQTSFAAAPPLAVPRRGHGTALAPQGLLVVGGAATRSYELIGASGNSGGALPMPIALPSPPLPQLATLTAQATPIAIADHGIYCFGGSIAGDGTAICGAMLFIEPGPGPGVDARRQAMVYSQSSALGFAPPIDTLPVAPSELVIPGLVQGLKVGQQLLITGNPPLAQTRRPVTKSGGTVPAGTMLMPIERLALAKGSAWLAQQTDGSLITLYLDASAEGLADFLFMSGNGSTIGNIPANALSVFDRPSLAETITLSAIEVRDAGSQTVLHLAQPMRYLYDRTTTTLYGNVASLVEGTPVSGEVLGSGDGRTAFQKFLLKQAPLVWVDQSDGSLLPEIDVKVGGAPWQRVTALDGCGPNANAYQIIQDSSGRTLVQFGDGIHGQRLPTGTDNITADYRVGAGSAGNVPAGSLNRAPANVGGIKSVVSPVAAAGGIDPPPGRHLRAAIPTAVSDLGRIVTQADMLSFLRNRPEVGAATLAVAHQPTEMLPLTDDMAATPAASDNGLDQPLVPLTLPSLLTIAGPDNAVPDMTSNDYKALRAAFDAALAAPLPHELLAYVPEPFKLSASFTATHGSDPQSVQAAMIARVRAVYATPRRRFGEPVFRSDIEKLLGSVAGVSKVTVDTLWLASQTSAANAVALYPQGASVGTGASILVLSPDSDAVDITPITAPAA